MTKRNKRLIVLMVVQIVGLFAMIFRDIQRPWEITVAAGLELDVATLSRLRDDDEHGRLLAMWNAP